MKLDEAIQVKTRWKMQNYPPPLADEINADNLSIEALKRLQEQRSGTGPLDEEDLLPGETVEDTKTPKSKEDVIEDGPTWPRFS
ncbi:hypothetical protein LCGC14_1887020 [marine sediment metagenome]|uniref:Uncharacterized protein n=1 Tax=marine sediment metagenome TaxID=412755 RepID=A0A0F9G0S4_9ZZZZ